jgi:hypothetical protein
MPDRKKPLIVTVSRRKPDVKGRYEHVAVDLLDRAQTSKPSSVLGTSRMSWAEMVVPGRQKALNEAALEDQKRDHSRRRRPRCLTAH